MMNVILFQPEIPPNTGNIIRLCANTGAQLHLIQPLGFTLEDKQLRRAGLDYHEHANIRIHDSLTSCMQALPGSRLLAFSTKGKHPYHKVEFQAGDSLLFGPETRGLPAEILASLLPEQRLYIPMLPHSRSLNLSNAVAVAVFEAWRQCKFAGTAE